MLNLQTIKARLKKEERLKRFVHSLIIHPIETRPRLWVKWFLNPFFSKRGRGSVVRRTAQLNVSPINRFVLGERSIVEDRCLVDNAVGDVLIGNNTRIGLNNTVIGPVTVGNYVITAQNVVLSALNHNYADVNRPIRMQGITQKKITIEDEAWIGANCVITSGITIGRHSVVAAGSVVVKDVPPYSVCAGVPARVIKLYDKESEMWVSVKK